MKNRIKQDVILIGKLIPWTIGIIAFVHLVAMITNPRYYFN